MTDVELKIPIILAMCYPLSWLEEPAEDDAEGRTNREVQTEVGPGAPVAHYSSDSAQLYRKRILTTAPQHLIGALSQMCAGLTHHVTSEVRARLSV
jgi:hypothetical protein